jgi:poly(A) polymerase
VDGYGDVVARRVRFIGSAAQRIEEDYLRILRFFRFSALYGKGSLDAQGLAACIAGKQGLARLSAERIKKEIFKLLVAPFASAIIERMIDVEVMGEILPGRVLPQSFANLVRIKPDADALLRLAVLAGGDIELMMTWAKRLKLSKKETACLASLGRHVEAFSSTLEEGAQKVLLYRLGEKLYRQCVVLAWSLEGQMVDVFAWEKMVTLPQRWQVPVFLPTGEDVLALGMKAGPQVGEVLLQLEQKWIDAEFEWDAQEQMAQLKTMVEAK